MAVSLYKYRVPQSVIDRQFVEILGHALNTMSTSPAVLWGAALLSDNDKED